MVAENYKKLIVFFVMIKLVSSADFDAVKISEGNSNTTQGNVLKEEIISIKWPKLHKRSDDETIPLTLMAFQKTILLNLKETILVVGPNTPVYYMSIKFNKIYSKQEYPFNNLAAQLYEDPRQMASLIVTTDSNGEKHIESGIVGTENITFTRVTDDLLRANNSIASMNEGDSFMTRLFDDIMGITPVNGGNNPNMYEHKPTAPHFATVYPEVLVIADDTLVNKFSSKNELFYYLINFWHKVGMLYTPMKMPEYKISIAGIVIPEDIRVLTFMNSNSYAQSIRERLNYKVALPGLGKWLYTVRNAIPVDSYDVAIVQTLRESEVTFDIFSLSETTELGLAYVNNACKIDINFQEVSKVGITGDNGLFGGVGIAAHELGHTLGAQHDDRCGYGFIMGSRSSFESTPYEWSTCALRDFDRFLGTNPQCLYNVPEQYQQKPQPPPRKPKSFNPGSGIYGGGIQKNPQSEPGVFGGGIYKNPESGPGLFGGGIFNNDPNVIPGTRTKYSELDFNHGYTLKAAVKNNSAIIIYPQDPVYKNKLIFELIYDNQLYHFAVDPA